MWFLSRCFLCRTNRGGGHPISSPTCVLVCFLETPYLSIVSFPTYVSIIQTLHSFRNQKEKTKKVCERYKLNCFWNLDQTLNCSLKWERIRWCTIVEVSSFGNLQSLQHEWKAIWWKFYNMEETLKRTSSHKSKTDQRIPK